MADEATKAAEASRPHFLIHEACAVAVKWWQDAALADGADKHENGDGTTTAMMRTFGSKPSAEDVQAFGVALANVIAERITAFPTRDFTLSVDYGPQGLLATAIDALPPDVGNAMSAMGALPIKTSMWIEVSKAKVSVSHGYGAPDVVIYPVPAVAR